MRIAPAALLVLASAAGAQQPAFTPTPKTVTEFLDMCQAPARKPDPAARTQACIALAYGLKQGFAANARSMECIGALGQTSLSVLWEGLQELRNQGDLPIAAGTTVVLRAKVPACR